MSYVSMFFNVAIACSGLTNGIITFFPLPTPYSFGTMTGLELTIQLFF